MMMTRLMRHIASRTRNEKTIKGNLNKRGDCPGLAQPPPSILGFTLKTIGNLRSKILIYLIIWALYDEWSF